MGNEREQDDAAVVGRILNRLASEPVSSALEARILGDFDVQVRRGRPSLLAMWREVVWPGAPVWKPSLAFALSLLFGITAGALVPSSALWTSDTPTTQTVAADTAPALEISGDL